MIARFNIIVKKNTIKKGTEAEITEAQYLPSLKKTYYTVKTSTGFVYLATKRGLLKQYKNVILPPDPDEGQPKEETQTPHKTVSKSTPKLNKGQFAKVQPKSTEAEGQIQLF